MEYVEGRTLAEVLAQDGRLMPERAVEITESVCDALTFAHAGGIVHRDIKPGNIMITPSGAVKVMDFGIARATTQETVQQTVAVMGTASYLSPEQAQGNPTDARTDIYSLGVVLYEMLTGRAPFVGDSPVAVAVQHVQESPTPPSQTVAGVPADLEAVVLHAMAKNPANRYQTTDEFKQDLERVRAGQRVTAPATQVMAPVAAAATEEEDERKRWVIPVVIGALVVAAIVLALILLNGGGSPSPLPSVSPTTNKVAVPQVVGLSQAAALQQIAAAGLPAPHVNNKQTDAAAPGNVFRQDPPQGTNVAPSTQITIWVAEKPTASPTPGTVAVPSVVGKSQQKAEKTLSQAGFTVSATQQASSQPAGKVASQSPTAGAQAPHGSNVSIVVSTGPQQVSVPSVVCLPITKAEKQLQAAGLQFTIGSVSPNPACPQANKVGAQNPAANTQVDAGSTVTLSPAA
jgi:serine/threonine-protein kinase